MMFNKKHDNKEKTLKPVSHNNVVKMKLAYKDVIEKKLSKVVTKDMSDSHIHKLRKFIITQTFNREKNASKELKRIATSPEDEIRIAIALEATSPFNTTQRREIKEAAQQRYKKHGHGLLGTGARRLYFPLLTPVNKKSRTEKTVEKYLNKKGYFIRNYKQGYATDLIGKQEYKIGKLIKADEKLSKSFMMDDTRFADKQYFVLSDYANDIAYMSTRRGWQSCMSHDGMYKNEPIHDIEHGTLVGYLINKNDPYIFDPLARILFKPLHNKKGDTKYETNKSYGLSHEIFKETAQLIAEQISSNEDGLYKTPINVYNDGTTNKKISIPDNIGTEDFLGMINVEYIKTSSGGITVLGDLEIIGLEITELPDLTNVTVMGYFNCDSNNLTSLIGSPKEVQGDFYCRNNKLTSLIGVTQNLGKDFLCGSNQLTSLDGLPQKINGYFSCTNNELTSLETLPKDIKGSINCSSNKITSLKGTPKIVNGTFDCSYNKLKSLKYAPQEVSEKFSCEHNMLTSLACAPQIVEGSFNCSYNKLKSLIGAPKKVYSLSCYDNKITSLIGGPTDVTGSYYCTDNPLMSLYGAPKMAQNIMSDMGSYLSYDNIPDEQLIATTTRSIFCKVRQALF